MTVQMETAHYSCTMTFPKCFTLKPPCNLYVDGMCIVYVHKLRSGDYLHYTTSVIGETFWFVSWLKI